MVPTEGSRAGEERGQLCWCPPGRFKMGLAGVDVTLSQGFWMSKYLVTQTQYLQVMGENPSGFVGFSLPVESTFKWEAEDYARELTLLEREAGRLSGDWEYRLPTDAQWEYACRAGTTTAYPFGDEPSRLGEYAWYRENSGNRTHEVGQKKPNPWGLYDMHGNCLEFTRDAWLAEPPGGVDPVVTGDDVPPRPGQSPEPFALGRGGGWFFPAQGCASAVRSRLGTRDRGYQLGFRVALVRTGATEATGDDPAECSRAYLRAFREGRYADGVAMMAPDMTSYPPTGPLRGMPKNKDEVTEVYHQLHAQGLRLLLQPRDFRVQRYGDVAIVTFTTQGTWWVPPEEPPVLRRVTQVWRKIDGKWFVTHGHNSDYRDE